MDQIVEKIGGDRLGERIGVDESGSDGTSLDSLSGHKLLLLIILLGSCSQADQMFQRVYL